MAGSEDFMKWNSFAHEKGLSREEVTKRYADWAADAGYDKDVTDKFYKGAAAAADAAAHYFPNEADRKKVKILDIAAGSGFVAQKLKERGFEIIDALEPCGELLKLAQKKGVYTRVFENYIDGTVLDTMEADYYDACVSSGGMGEGHIPCEGIDEMIRVTKPGGFVIIVMREEYLKKVADYCGRLEPRMEKFQSEGAWTRLAREPLTCYSFQNQGLVFVYKVLISGRPSTQK